MSRDESSSALFGGGEQAPKSLFEAYTLPVVTTPFPVAGERRQRTAPTADAATMARESLANRERVLEQREKDVNAALIGHAKAIDELARAASEFDAKLSEQATELGIAVASAILDRELRNDRDYLTSRLLESFARLSANRGQTSIRVCASDLPWIREQCELGDSVDWVADPALAPGGFEIENAHQLLDGAMETRLAAIRQALIEDLDDAGASDASEGDADAQ